MLGLLLYLLWLPQLADYDPLLVTGPEPVAIDLLVWDQKRNREIPIRVRLPQASNAPIVLFSHGLGGSRTNNAFLAIHWAKRGYVTVFLQHPGSDESVWRELPPSQRYAAMKDAASAKNLKLRTEDVPAVLDQLAIWNHEATHRLYQAMDLNRIGMSGHSFGAGTSQAVGGQWYPLVRSRWWESRIDAAVMFSPSAPQRGDLKKAFGSVSIPWFLFTGTEDDSPIGGQSAADRLKVFPALPPGDKYECVLFGARHSAFGDRDLPGDSGRNPNHHRILLAFTTAYWDAYLKQNPAALVWLQGPSARALLQSGDTFQFK
ncbi:MAG: dienelactone hydrolase [Acidobacteria bacterium]|nr:dienelactone hydrolase [Acidobacteriota bacterium]MCB9398000.1 dienelactone hydrolase [Acidobacteriota bacterium]